MQNNDCIPDSILIFDLKGPFAHFRKYYTNSSSLSYIVPPRTVINGIIAGLIGLPSEKHTNDKDKLYYEKFNSDNCFIAVSMKNSVKKLMQTVNYCFTKTQNNEIYFSKHSQIPLEILKTISQHNLTYRIYFFHKDENIYLDLKERLKTNKFVFPPYLGLSEFLAWIKFIDEGSISTVSEITELNSVCKLEYIEELNPINESKYLTEKMPTGFTNERHPLKVNDYLIEINGKSINAKFKSEVLFYKAEYEENNLKKDENISPL